MSASFYDLMKYAATGIASPDMTAYDKARALAAFGGGKTQTMTGIPPLTFKADGKPLISWSMKGNGSQTGTPTPDNPVIPTFCGKLVGTDWTIPITCAGQTVPVYLGQTQTVRRIRKLVLDGTEWTIYSNPAIWASNAFYITIADYLDGTLQGYCTHYQTVSTTSAVEGIYFGRNISIFTKFSDELDTVEKFKSYLAQQYANGTPVTVWYVLATPITGIVNEPLAKIGDYADELHSTDAGVTIPTTRGQNTLTVDTDLQPSEMTITYKG